MQKRPKNQKNEILCWIYQVLQTSSDRIRTTDPSSQDFSKFWWKYQIPSCYSSTRSGGRLKRPLGTLYFTKKLILYFHPKVFPMLRIVVKSVVYYRPEKRNFVVNLSSFTNVLWLDSNHGPPALTQNFRHLFCVTAVLLAFIVCAERRVPRGRFSRPPLRVLE